MEGTGSYIRAMTKLVDGVLCARRGPEHLPQMHLVDADAIPMSQKNCCLGELGDVASITALPPTEARFEPTPLGSKARTQNHQVTLFL